MMQLYINTGIMSFLFLLVFGIAELAYIKLNLKVEITRKGVHIASGMLCLSFPDFIQNKWLVLALTVNFFILLTVSIKFDFLKSINKVDRKTYGSFLFPLTIFILYYTYQEVGSLVFYYLPLLIFAVSDPLGALVGKSYPIIKYTLFNQQKSLGGALAFFCSALIICFTYFYWFCILDFKTSIMLISVAVLATLAEGLSFKGTDNITVPLTVVLVLFLML